ncbi:Hint domain-containing protein [Flavobacterium restrictum]|uniref:Hint domain-containing protein n=1 Tax=Flavobacterium restrictum TaxID=2594428 RepID=A0A553ECH4_9FLAO|nr:Hint domain-containing protein [Flavobacterium restrictum]TRX42754.1 hypothetical protein FNW21_00005 [Flavobacterium restrictum]
MKRGYFLWDKLIRNTNSTDGKREVEFKALVIESNYKVCAWVMIYKNIEGKTKYFCIPTQESSKEIWDKCFIDLRDTNLQTTAYLPITWAMMNLIGQLTNDYNNVCFSKGSMVLTQNMQYKTIETITNEDTLVVYDNIRKKLTTSKVKKLVTHDESKYEVYKITFTQKEELYADNSETFSNPSIIDGKKVIEATANHPILTNNGIKRIDELEYGNEVLVVNTLGETLTYIVSNIQKNYRKVDSVYNVILENGNTFVVDGVIVSTK